ASFDWRLSNAVTCNTTSPKPTLVSVSTGENEEPFASFYVGNGAAPATLNLPTAVKTLFVSYQTATGVSKAQSVSVNNAAMTFAVGDDCTMPLAVAKTSAFGAIDFNTENGVVYVPAKKSGWGTVLFEDLWPSYGDYDFNDMVANYKIQFYLDAQNAVEAMQFGVRVKAVGGSLPYDLYLQLPNLAANLIGDVEVISPSTAGTAIVQIPTTNRACFRFDGMRNKNVADGSAYFNTEYGHEIPEANMVELYVVVYFTESVALDKLTSSAPDFFIAKKDANDQIAKEIHCRDFEPVNQPLYEEIMNASKTPITHWYYSAESNLVWGLNIPKNIQHIYEAQNFPKEKEYGDFLKAYPQFKEWAESGGVKNPDWYVHGVKSLLVKEL
ncbi:MAG: LruC domain-containing protein, partial [Alistipes sp.]